MEREKEQSKTGASKWDICVSIYIYICQFSCLDLNEPWNQIRVLELLQSSPRKMEESLFNLQDKAIA